GGLVLDYARPFCRKARMVGSKLVADHASCLDDGYDGGDGHAGSWSRGRGVTCRDLLFETGEARPDCLGCSPWGRRSWDTAAIVSCRCSGSWHSAQERPCKC